MYKDVLLNPLIPQLYMDLLNVMEVGTHLVESTKNDQHDIT